MQRPQQSWSDVETINGGNKFTEEEVLQMTEDIFEIPKSKYYN